MKTLDQYIEAASERYSRYYAEGRFAVGLVAVGKPRQGLSSASHWRVDCYLDGKRVKREVFLEALKGA